LFAKSGEKRGPPIEGANCNETTRRGERRESGAEREEHERIEERDRPRTQFPIQRGHVFAGRDRPKIRKMMCDRGRESNTSISAVCNAHQNWLRGLKIEMDASFDMQPET